MGLTADDPQDLSSVDDVSPDAALTRELALSMYNETDLPVQRIAELLRVSRGSIYAWLKAAGISGDRRAGVAGAVGHSTALPEMEFDELVRAVERIDGELRQLSRDLVAERGENARTLARVLGLLEGYISGAE